MNDKLTIVLPLKDRPLCTNRFLYDLHQKKCPFKILIADGSSDSDVQRDLLKEKKPLHFSNLNYEYVKYEYDKSLSNFFDKMEDISLRITTKYATQQDNDDFLDMDGMYKSIEILDGGKYYSTRGAIIHIPGEYNMHTEFPNPITGNTSADRVVDQSKHFHTNWHNVMYSDIVKMIWGLIKIAQPTNFRFVEQINCYVPIAIGDGHRGDFAWITHVLGERTTTSEGSLQDHFPDQVTWIMSNHWLDNFNKMTEIVGCLIAKYDIISVEQGMKAFREAYPLKLPNLKDLLNNRINEAKNIGYDYNRISKICKVIDKWRL